jgi:uncharacterized ferredoxin-like protein
MIAPYTTSEAVWVANAESQSKRNLYGSEQLSHQHSFSSQEEILDESSYFEEVIEDDMTLDSYSMNLIPRTITIRFDEFDEMQTILHINDYTNNEIHKTWYESYDYDRMISAAKKTAEEFEFRLQELGKLHKKPIAPTRGLEAMTTSGATKVKLLKEKALDAVWQEQTRQRSGGYCDPDRIRSIYFVISEEARTAAQNRGFSDELVAKRIREEDQKKLEKKQNLRLLGKSKRFVKNTAKVTTGGVRKTTKLVGKTTILTGKVAFETTKRTVKAGVATATLDGKMLKEAVTIKTKKREVDKQIVRLPSQSALDASKMSGEANVENTPDLGYEPANPEKRENMKLLGLVPIPGTQKTYDEDRRQMKIQKRRKATRRASWGEGTEKMVW